MPPQSAREFASGSRFARVGVMQGRLSPMVNGKIQAFPWNAWREEFATANALQVRSLEWTLDYERMDENPLMTRAGRGEIRALSEATGTVVRSLTGDCFMQKPFWKAEGAEREQLTAMVVAVVEACSDLAVRYVVVPLVDNGRVENGAQEALLLETFARLAPTLRDSNVAVVVESDFVPRELRRLLLGLPDDVFGVNYDTGNSASLGFDPREEIELLAGRIFNVHIKDRLRGGTTVPLGSGAADLPFTIALLERAGYRGAYVLQTARASDGDHAGAIRRYRDSVADWIEAAHRGS